MSKSRPTTLGEGRSSLSLACRESPPRLGSCCAVSSFASSQNRFGISPSGGQNEPRCLNHESAYAMTETVNSRALVRSSNGQVSNQAQDAAPANNNENQENVQQAAPQQQPAFSYWSVFKGLLFRAAIIYFMTSWFRGQPANQNAGGGSGQPGATPASSNLYPNGTVMDMYMYISEGLNL
ncbi:hypothetical protein MTO96_023581 [Rhipicephalus appendiculatus]